MRRTTTTDPGTTVPDATDVPPEALAWTLFLVYHDRAGALRSRHVVRRGESMEVARGAGAFGAVLPADERVSRRHARFLVDAAGALFVADEGSRNGVYVNAERVSNALLRPGDVVRVGGALLVVARAPAEYAPSDLAQVPGVSHPAGVLAARVRALASTAGTVLLCGEAGSPLVDLALALHELAARDGRAVVLEPSGSDANARLDDAATVIIRRAHAAGRSPLERLVRRAAEQAPSARVVMCWTARPGERVPADPSLDAVVREPRAARLEVPPIRTRPEDIPQLLALRAAARGLAELRPSHAIVTLLLRAQWPGNEAQLESAIDLLADPDANTDLAGLLAEPWDRPDAQHAWDPGGAARGAAYEVSAAGKWFVTPGGERVSLERRPILARLLGALASAYAGDARRCLSVDDLTTAAWPGERFVEDSAASRVYVSVSSLRRLGLRDLILRDTTGYRLDGARGVRITDDDG